MSNASPKKPDLSPCVIFGGRAFDNMLATIRSLGRRGVAVHVLAPSDTLPVYAASRFCTSVKAIPESQDADVLLSILRQKIQELGGGEAMLLPTNDRTCDLLDQRREEMEALGTLVLPRSEVVKTMIDKEKAREVVGKYGLTIPRTMEVDAVESLHQVAEEFRTPVILKPACWNSSGETVDFKTVRCADADSVRQQGEALLARGARLVAQEFIPGGDKALEFYMFYRARDGRTLYECTGRKLRQKPPGAGIMAAGEAVRIDDVREQSRQLIEGFDCHGCGGIEYKRFDGRLYFIEMSVRLEACHELAMKIGIDLPWLAYSDAMLGVCPEPVQQHHAYWLSGKAYIKQLLSFKDVPSALGEWLRMVLSGRCQFPIASLRDPLPMVKHLLYMWRRRNK